MKSQKFQSWSWEHKILPLNGRLTSRIIVHKRKFQNRNRLNVFRLCLNIHWNTGRQLWSIPEKSVIKVILGVGVGLNVTVSDIKARALGRHVTCVTCHKARVTMSRVPGTQTWESQLWVLGKLIYILSWFCFLIRNTQTWGDVFSKSEGISY